MHRTLLFLLLPVVFLGPSWEAEATAEDPKPKPKRHCPTGLYWRPLTRQCARDELTSEKPSPAGYAWIRRKKITSIIHVCPAGTYWVPRKRRCKKVSALPGGNDTVPCPAGFTQWKNSCTKRRFIPVRCHSKKIWDPKKRACVDVQVQQVGYETNTAAPEPIGGSGLDSGAGPIDSDPIGAMGSGVGSGAEPIAPVPITTRPSSDRMTIVAYPPGVDYTPEPTPEPIAPVPIPTRKKPGFFKRLKKKIWGDY